MSRSPGPPGRPTEKPDFGTHPRLLWPLLALLALFPVTARAAAGSDDISGVARIVDGDTVTIDARHIRLFGIDAPETDQICLDAAAKRWNCGLTARDRLAEHVAGRPMSCAGRGLDRYGRTLAVCRLGGEDLNAWMVRQGLALAYVHYAPDYRTEEDEARNARRGMWSGAFIAPWDWRHRNRGTVIQGALSVPVTAQAQLLTPRSSRGAPSPACTIKGNVNRNGERIYHLPGTSAYARTHMNKGLGERWFCSEDEARAAGWRKAGH
ncbi:MAG: thermonuclease family protein [Alphaproteobacteria bacterium]|nr:thermonuclease family protein [Alphaproteobacteria bacterium]